MGRADDEQHSRESLGKKSLITLMSESFQRNPTKVMSRIRVRQKFEGADYDEYENLNTPSKSDSKRGYEEWISEAGNDEEGDEDEEAEDKIVDMRRRLLSKNSQSFKFSLYKKNPTGIVATD